MLYRNARYILWMHKGTELHVFFFTFPDESYLPLNAFNAYVFKKKKKKILY